MPSRPFVAAVGQDFFEQRVKIGVFAAEVQDAVFSADGIAGDRHPLEHQVGPFGEDHAVLEGSRFAFVGVADDELLGAFGAAGEFPLHTGREPRPAAAAKPGGLDFADDFYRAHRQGVFQAGFL